MWEGRHATAFVSGGRTPRRARLHPPGPRGEQPAMSFLRLGVRGDVQKRRGVGAPAACRPPPAVGLLPLSEEPPAPPARRQQGTVRTLRRSGALGACSPACLCCMGTPLRGATCSALEDHATIVSSTVKGGWRGTGRCARPGVSASLSRPSCTNRRIRNEREGTVAGGVQGCSKMLQRLERGQEVCATCTSVGTQRKVNR